MTDALHVDTRTTRRTAGPWLLDGDVVLPLLGSETSLGLHPFDLRTHEFAFGPRPSALGSGGDRLLAALEAGGLTGRGGAHFPVARKWASVRAAGGGGTVVANGAEGEAASGKDAVLLQARAHLVLDGLALAGEATAARDGVIWLHEGAHATFQAVHAALAERRDAGLRDLPVRVLLGPDHYLTGETTSVIAGVRGRPALPGFVADPAAPWGRGEVPVLVHNIETLARVGLAARHPRVATLGSLLTVVGADRRVVHECAAGETLGHAVGATWPWPAPPAAVLLGGYSGQWLSWERARNLPLAQDLLAAAGHSLGAGVVVPLPVGACGVVETARLVRHLAASSARQCGPCLHGLPALAELTTRLAEGRSERGDLDRLDRIRVQVAGRGACRHPDGALRMLGSALETFADEVAVHRAGSCRHPGHPPVVPIPGRV